MVKLWVHVRMDDEDTEEITSMEAYQNGKKDAIRFSMESAWRLLETHEWFSDEDSKVEASEYISRNIKRAFTGDEVSISHKGDIQTFMDMGEGTSITVTIRVIYS